MSECDRQASKMAPDIFYLLVVTPLCNLLPLTWVETSDLLIMNKILQK